jgi:DDE superfamily endonuclease
MHRARDVPGVFPPELVAVTQQLACVAPSVMGYEMTVWSARTLAAVVEEVVGEVIHFTSVAMIMRTLHISLQQMRYCKTATWTDVAIERALSVLWTYEHVDHLLEKGEIIECLDEQPNLQVLSRRTDRWQAPGQPRRQEHEYKRKGVVNLLHGHRVHDGHHTIDLLPSGKGNDFRAHILQRAWHLQQQGVKRVHWIMDGAPSHTALDTQQLFEDLKPFARVVLLPAHSSWLNQAEASIGAFGRRYNLHGNWAGRAERIARLPSAVEEFNRLFAHRYNWSFTRADFKRWRRESLARAALSSETSATLD